MALDLIKKYFLRKSILTDKNDVGINKSTALDLDAYIQHRVDNSIDSIGDTEQITYTNGTVTNTVDTDYLSDHRLQSTSSSTANSQSFTVALVPSFTGAGLTTSGMYLIQAANTDGTAFYQTKQLTHSRPINLTEGVATTFLNSISIGNTVGSWGGIIVYTVFATDGTNSQSKSGRCLFDTLINGSGTAVVQITDTQNTTLATSGTLSVTISATGSGNEVQFKCSATSSLTQTTLNIRYHLIGN